MCILNNLLDILCFDESQTEGDVWFIQWSLLSQTLQAALQGRDGGDEEGQQGGNEGAGGGSGERTAKPSVQEREKSQRGEEEKKV